MSDLSGEANYVTRLSDWVAKQGLFFQLTHGSAVGGLGRAILSLLIRGAILLLVLGLGTWFYLHSLATRSSYSDKLAAVIEERLGTENTELNGVTRGSEGAFANIIEIGEIKMDAGAFTVFEPREDQSASGREQLDLELTSAVLSPVGVTDGIWTPWRVEEISADSLSAKIKLGGENEQDALRSHAWMFDSIENSPLRRLYVAKTNLSWGYAPQNLGFLMGCSLTGIAEGEEWNLTLADGMFRYLWLRDAKLLKADVRVTREKITITDASFMMGEGAVHLDAEIQLGEEPSVEGTIQFKTIPANQALNSKYKAYMNGTVSGSGKFSGSLVALRGLNYELDIELTDTDSFELTDKISVITALSVVDASANYENLSFSEGSFHVSHLHGTTKYSEIRMLADNGIVVVGDFQLRTPGEVELQRDLKGEDSSNYKKEFEAVLNRERVLAQEEEEEKVLSFTTDIVDDSLATQQRQKNYFEELGGEGSTLKLEDLRSNTSQIKRKFAAIRRFEGEVKIGVSEAAFQRSERLRLTYPFDQESQKHWVIVPLSGAMKDVSKGTSQALYELGRRVRSIDK